MAYIRSKKYVHCISWTEKGILGLGVEFIGSIGDENPFLCPNSNSTITSCQMFFCFLYKITKNLNGKNKAHDILQLGKYKLELEKKDI